MNEVQIPIILKVTIGNRVFVLCATLIKEATQPYLVIQLKPLYH